MKVQDPKKEFSDLDFYIWRVKGNQLKDWPEEIFLHGTDEALKTIDESLSSLLTYFKKFNKGTRKFKCNITKDFDFEKFGKEKRVKFQWFDWFIVKLIPDAQSNIVYQIEDKNIILSLDPKALEEFITALKSQYSGKLQYPHGRQVPGKLYFAPDWLGME